MKALTPASILRADPARRTFRSFDDVIDARAIRALFQPLVSADDGVLLGYEGLARGPVGTPWEFPDALFRAAEQAGRLAELDWVCRAAIATAAVAGNLGTRTSIFINAEPGTIGTPCPADLRAPLVDSLGQLRLVVELTERAISADPAGMLIAAAEYRTAGVGLALDDVGADPASLALTPLLEPDLIKLDMALVRNPHAPSTARVVNSVLAHAERTGALILAEGIETVAELATAKAMGAQIIQGWLTGRPGPLPAIPPRGRFLELPKAGAQSPPGHWLGQMVNATAPISLAGRDRPTPWQLLGAGSPTRTTTKGSLLSISRYLEAKGVDGDEPPVVLGCFQHARYFTTATRRRYTGLGQTAALVGVIGTGIEAVPVPGVRGADLAPDDPLCGEWNVIVVGPHFAGALIAHDRGDTGPEGERRFDYLITYDRGRVLTAARALLHWLAPIGGVTTWPVLHPT